jgi:hypothetical protein
MLRQVILIVAITLVAISGCGMTGHVRTGPTIGTTAGSAETT